MRINTNIASMTAQESANNVNKALNSSLEKLSSGLRINKASDDASGLSIADKLKVQASSLKQSIDNANSANALVQIADKAMAEQSNILDIIKQKLIQASTSTTSDEGREAIRKDIYKLQTQLNNIADQTNYNGEKLLQKDVAIGDVTTTEGEDTQTATRVATTAGTASVNQVDTITITNVEEGDTFTISISSGEDIEYTAEAGDDADAVAAQLVALWNASTDAENSKMTAAATGSGGELTLTNDTKSTTQLGTSASAANRAEVTATEAGTIGTDILEFQVGELSTNKITSSGGVNATREGLGLTDFASSDSLTVSAAEAEMALVDSAISTLNGWRSDFGSTQNQLESSIRNMMTTQTNIKAAESVIRDVDYAAESAEFNKQNIISQAGTYALSQANAIQQNVLRLLQ